MREKTDIIRPEFYQLSMKLAEKLFEIPDLRHYNEWEGKYNEIGDIITEFDKTLKHVTDRNLHLYFDYSDLVEELLISCMLRNIRPENVREIWIRIVNYFDTAIELVNTTGELSDNRFLCITDDIDRIKSRLKEDELLPTLEEMDIEIERELDYMTDEEKRELYRQLRG